MDLISPNSVAGAHRSYSPRVLEHYENPRNVGEVVDPDAASWVESSVHGDRLKLTLRISGGKVAEARFRAFGCGAAIASSSMATVLLTGRTLEEAARLTREEVAAALGGLPESKIHCSVLAEEAIRRALEDYGRRQAAATQDTAPRQRTSEEKEST
jgi:nitrogen fixation NifU-like protein